MSAKVAAQILPTSAIAEHGLSSQEANAAVGSDHSFLWDRPIPGALLVLARLGSLLLPGRPGLRLVLHVLSLPAPHLCLGGL